MKLIYFILVFVPVRSHYANSTGTPEKLISSPCTDKYHFFLAPGVLTAGGTNRACISRFYPEGPARMLLSLIAQNKTTSTASRDLLPGDGGCVDISVPLLPNTKADLVINIWYHEAKCTWERRMTVRISSGKVVVVHTERARYRPGETLKARVFALKADLTPAPGNVEEIWIEGPPGAWEGSRVAQWTKVRSKMGLAQVQHEIDELAPPGRWTVRARLADGSQGSAAFWVGNYELPPFQLTVRHAPRVLRTSERLVWTVCVRYPWTEAVEGMLVIRLRGADSAGGGVRTAVRLRAPRACHRHAAAARRLALAHAHPPTVLVADFSFQEEGTRVWQNTTVVTQVVDKRVSLEFLTKHRTIISPGLPYKLKVKATRWDDKPSVNTRIRVCRFASLGEHMLDTNTNTSTPTCISGDTDSSGIARVMFAADDEDIPFYRFEASLSNDTTTTAGPLTLATRRSAIQAALGPLRADSRGTRTFVPLYLSLQNVTRPVTVHFVVITRGGIIYRWGATTQCPIASTAVHVQTASRNSKCNSPMSQYGESSKNKELYEEMSQYDDSQYGDHKSQNKIQYGHNNIQNDNKNRDDSNKRSRSYNSNTNQFANSDSDKTSGYIIRNMNQNDKNNYINRNIENDKNHTIFDRFSAVNIRPNIVVKVNDGNDIQYEANASDALLNRHLLRVMLPIKVTQQMCPDSHLIAYFYYNGEFVSASKHFELDDCFVNKVEATFLTRQALPGSPATIQLSTPGPALCALTALDSAAKWSGSNPVRDVLMRGLKRMVDGHRNLTEYDAAGECFLSAETPSLPANNLELTTSWLAAAGVRTIGDITVNTNCDTPAFLIDEGTIPRSDFSEAWLWRLVTVNSNNVTTTTAKAPDSITRYEANAVCLSKTGIAVSPPAVLQVFRDFFIHADSPKRLRRGDTSIVRYRLFNYLYEPLSVQIQIITDSLLQGPVETVESVCVPPRASAPRRASLIAKGVGESMVVIRAKAVSDGTCKNSTNRRGVSDEVIMKITIEPEGLPIEEHKSALLCGIDNTISSKSKVSWSWPPAVMVPGTEKLMVWATGDMAGPLLADADSLVLLPRGCGEQNMARLATNLLALSQLHPETHAAVVAKEHVARGFTRQLQYIHPSGGFSAFGASDATSSTWLTAFCLRYLRRAHKLLWPTQPIPPAIEKAERWLLNQQMENGCFRNEGQVFHRELRGGLTEEGEIASVALTAYVVTSLTFSPTPLPPRTLRNSLSCLRALPPLKHYTPARVYANSLLAYAFVKMEKYEEELRKTNEAKYEDLQRTTKLTQENLRSSEQPSWLTQGGMKENEGLMEVMELVKMAKREGEYMWWETGSLSTSIEATSYALLALTFSPAVLHSMGAGAVRWLASHRGLSGGFVSTQDTLVALEALTAWSSVHSSPTNLTVSARSGTVSKTAFLHPELLIPEVIKMGVGNKLDIAVEGTGCALVQATRSYNSPSATPLTAQSSLSLQLTVHTDGTFDCDRNGTNCYCAAVIETCVSWRGAFPAMCALEVTLPGGFGADAARLYAQLQPTDSLLRRIELTPTGSRTTLYLSGRDATPPHARTPAHACYNIHAVGTRGRTAPAHVTLMDYYSPAVHDTQFYTIPEDCPSRVSHESNLELTSDNIYNNARSLTNRGEILINHEYTFEDIPEGIPIEDPLYDNLTRRDKEKADLRNIEGNNANPSKTIDKIQNEAPVTETVDPNSVSVNDVNSVPKNVKANESETQRNVIIDDNLNIGDINELFNSLKGLRTNKVQTTTKVISHVDLSKRLDRSDEVKLNEGNAREKGANIINSYSDKQEPEQSAAKIIDISKKNTVSTETSHRIEIRNEHETTTRIDNPSLHDFHVIDTERDLDVPSGIEGPIPSRVLPPHNYAPPYLPYSPTEELYVTTPRNFVSHQVGKKGYIPMKFQQPQFVPAPLGNVTFNENPLLEYSPYETHRFGKYSRRILGGSGLFNKRRSRKFLG